MKLPLRDFADVITALKGPGENSGAAEKRLAARMTVSARINVHLLNGQQIVRSFSVLTRDISLTGIGLLQSVAVAAKQNLILALPRPHTPLFVIAEAMHCRPLADGLLAVGMEYVEMASKETCEALLTSGKDQHARIRDSVLR